MVRRVRGVGVNLLSNDEIRCLDCNIVLAVIPSDHYFRWAPGCEPICIYVHRIQRSTIPQIAEPPYYNAEDDSWFDALPRLWFDADGARVAVTGYKIGDGPWIPLPRPLPVVDSQMPIVVTTSAWRGKVVYGDLALDSLLEGTNP